MTGLDPIIASGIVAVVSGLLSGLMVGIFMFWLEERRELRDRRREDYRIATNWDIEGKKPSLRNFDLTGANLSGHKLTGADLEGSNLEYSEMWATDFTGANLRRAKFRKAKLVGVQFTNAVALLADFSMATISRRIYAEMSYIPNFSWATMSRANFRYARVDGAIFEGANLTSADFTGAKIRNTDFSGADLSQSNWRKVKEVSNCTWKSVKISHPADFPEWLQKEIQHQNVSQGTVTA
jgi:hypothetical protein